MGWTNVLMAFVDLMLSSDIDSFDDFYVTRPEIVRVTGFSITTVSNNLSVCVKHGWLKRVELNNGNGREVRYYINNVEIINFVNKYLR